MSKLVTIITPKPSRAGELTPCSGSRLFINGVEVEMLELVRATLNVGPAGDGLITSEFTFKVYNNEMELIEMEDPSEYVP